MSTTLSAIFSYSFMKKSLPFCISNSKPSPFLVQMILNHRPLSLSASSKPAFSSINPPGKTPPEFPSLSPPEEFNFSVPDEMPHTPKVPDFDPIPPEKPPPLSPPGLNPEFPGPPVPERPGPEGPQPPLPPPSGPDFPKGPPNGPEIVPAKPPEVGPFPNISLEIPGPIGGFGFVYM